jgi:hypothetical protein
MYAVMGTKGQDTTTTNVYDLHSATVFNIHNTSPNTKAERNAEYYKRKRNQGNSIRTDI